MALTPEKAHERESLRVRRMVCDRARSGHAVKRTNIDLPAVPVSMNVLQGELHRLAAMFTTLHSNKGGEFRFNVTANLLRAMADYLPAVHPDKKPGSGQCGACGHFNQYHYEGCLIAVIQRVLTNGEDTIMAPPRRFTPPDELRDRLTSQFCEKHKPKDYFGRCPACVCDDLEAERASNTSGRLPSSDAGAK